MNKKVFSIILTVVMLAVLATPVFADKPVGFDSHGNETAWEKSSSTSDCVKIQSGLITDSAGNPITTGFDQFGYNYQAHMFNGTYDSSDRNIDGTYWGATGDYVDDKLIMKWSDSWLANVDCNGDNKLDRGLENGVVGGKSKGWLTNHVEGDYFDTYGNTQNYINFVKIVWTGPGSPLWGEFTIIEEVYNDPADGYHGLYDKWADPTGLGQYK